MKNLNLIFISVIVILSFNSCGGGVNNKKGSDLKGEDAIKYLAGKERKYWQLDKGHDYYEYIQFEQGGKGIGTKGIDLTYKIKDDEIELKDYLTVKFKIVEINNDKMILLSSKQDSLTYLYIEPGSELAKEKPYLEINPKWLNGQYGTCWKFSDGGKIYSYMNDGSIIDAISLRKIADWKINDNTLMFGQSNCTIRRLSPIYFDYDAMGYPVTLNYYSEANIDGTPTKKE